MRIAITGASGWIGSFVARSLSDQGHTVHAIVRPGHSVAKLSGRRRGIIYHVGAVDEMPIQADVLIAMAWASKPADYLTTPENTACLDMTKRLLATHDGRAVVIGTCFEYDTRLGRLSEDNPLRPLTLYSKTKSELCSHVKNRPDTAYLRLFYQYGPLEHPDRFVPKVIRKLLLGERVEIKSRSVLRDYTHVSDVARAIAVGATSSATGVLNVGSGKAIATRELALQAESACGLRGMVSFGTEPAYPDEPIMIEADNSKLLALGWKPEISLEQGMKETVEWWKSQGA